jgi:hypothetical protein
MSAEWKSIEPHKAYSVSSDGQVRNDRTQRVLNPPVMKNGYRSACLSIDGVKKFVNVHRLVAMAFVEGFSSGLHVNHIDGDKLNNDRSNLEWCTQSANNAHARDTGLNKSHLHAVEKMNSATRKPVEQISLESGEVVATFASMSEARRATGICTIHDCISGRQATAGGSSWRYMKMRCNMGDAV